ncbi:MAG: hypothetical protein ACK4S0_10810, partial [Sediminibacterium sp.]
MKKLISISLLFFLIQYQSLAQEKSLRIGVAGLNHGHGPWVLNADKRHDIDIVGIAEPDRKLAEKY